MQLYQYFSLKKIGESIKCIFYASIKELDIEKGRTPTWKVDTSFNGIQVLFLEQNINFFFKSRVMKKRLIRLTLLFMGGGWSTKYGVKNFEIIMEDLTIFSSENAKHNFD